MRKTNASNTCSVCGQRKVGASASNGLAPCYSCINKMRVDESPLWESALPKKVKPLNKEHEEAVKLAKAHGASIATPLHGAHGVVKYPGIITMQYEQLAALIAEVRRQAMKEGAKICAQAIRDVLEEEKC